MEFLNSSPVTFVSTGGGALRVLRASGKSLRFGTSRRWSATSGIRSAKSLVLYGAKLKFSAPSQLVSFRSSGEVHAATSSRSSPCVSSPPSRTLARMQNQDHFFSAHAVRRTQSSSVQCYFGQHQNPAPNPSFEPTPTGKPVVAAQVNR